MAKFSSRLASKLAMLIRIQLRTVTVAACTLWQGSVNSSSTSPMTTLESKTRVKLHTIAESREVHTMRMSTHSLLSYGIVPSKSSVSWAGGMTLLRLSTEIRFVYTQQSIHYFLRAPIFQNKKYSNIVEWWSPITKKWDFENSTIKRLPRCKKSKMAALAA